MKGRILFTAMAALGLMAFGAMEASAQNSVQDQLPATGFRWLPVFGAAPTDPQTPSSITNAFGTTNPTIYNNQTIRQVVHLSGGLPYGIRIRLTNALSSTPITFSDVNIGLWAGTPATATSPGIVSAAIKAGSNQPITFAYGQTSITVPPYGEVVSDPISYSAPAGTDIMVSLYVPAGNTTPATLHFLGNTNVYFAAGDVSSSTTIVPQGTTTLRPFVSSVESAAPATNATIVTLGDSITDGAYSSTDGDNRWPDDLAVRLRAAYGDVFGISNAGIGAGAVLTNTYGMNAVARLTRDVLSTPGVKYVVLLEGVNDIGSEPGLTAAQLEAGYRAIIARCHEVGIYVYGGTILPFGNSSTYSAANEALRQSVNTFIRMSGAYDGVIDFDAAVRDPRNPTQILAAYNSDNIHPNVAGYQAMANIVNLSLFNPATH